MPATGEDEAETDGGHTERGTCTWSPEEWWLL